MYWFLNWWKLLPIYALIKVLSCSTIKAILLSYAQNVYHVYDNTHKIQEFARKYNIQCKNIHRATRVLLLVSRHLEVQYLRKPVWHHPKNETHCQTGFLKYWASLKILHTRPLKVTAGRSVLVLQSHCNGCLRKTGSTCPFCPSKRPWLTFQAKSPINPW